MEKVEFLSVLVVCFVFALGALSSYLDKRSEMKKHTDVQANVHQRINTVLMGGIHPTSRSALSASPFDGGGIGNIAFSGTGKPAVSLGYLENKK